MLNQNKYLEIKKGKTKTFQVLLFLIIATSGFFIVHNHQLEQNLQRGQSFGISINQYQSSEITGSLLASSKKRGLLAIQRLGLTSTPNIISTNAEKSIILREVYYDAIQLTLGLEFRDFGTYTDFRTKIFTNSAEIVADREYIEIFKVSENLYYKNITIQFKEREDSILPGKLNADILFFDQTEKTPYGFNLDLNRNLTDEYTKIYPVNKTYSISGNLDISVNRIVFTPACTYVEYDTPSYRYYVFNKRYLTIQDNHLGTKYPLYEGDRDSLSPKKIESHYTYFDPFEQVPEVLKLQFFLDDAPSYDSIEIELPTLIY